MPPPPARRALAALLRRLALGASAGMLAALAVLMAMRATHPYDLEWMEGGMADHAARVLAGQPLYVEPSVDFTPFIYTPLVHWIGAASMALLGEGLPALRAVSIAATVLLLVLIVGVVRRETGHRDAGLVAAGLFAATWELTGAWIDLARVDALFLLLLAASVAVLRASRGVRGDAAAALLALLAFLAKQSALPVAAALALWTLVVRRGSGRLAFAGLLFVGIAGTTVVGDALTGGWYSYYVFELPAEHRLVSERIAGFWLDDLRAFLPALLAAFAVPVLAWRAGDRRTAGFFAALLAGTVATSWAGRVHVGGWLNAALPLALAVSLTIGAGLPVIARALARRRGETSVDEVPGDPSAWRSARTPLREPLVAAAIVLQLALLLHDPRDRLPTAADEQAGDALVERLAEIEGGIFVPFHGALARRAGHAPHAHGMALEDVFRGGDETRRTRLRRELSEALHDGRFEVVVLDMDRWGMQAELAHRYERGPPPVPDDDAFTTVTGFVTRPRAWYGLREAPTRAP